MHAGARGDAEETSLRVDRIELTVGAVLHPADVVAHGLDLPLGQGRDEHGEVGLAARRGERRCDVLGLAGRGGQLQDEHVLGEPAVVTCHDAGDPESEALLSEQRVPAVARAEGDDLSGLREVDDVLVVSVAGPGDVCLTLAEWVADRVEARHEVAVGAKDVEGSLAHAGHDAHRHRHVGGVGDLDADVGDLGAERAHREGHHVHRAALHAAVEELVEHATHLCGVTPVVGRASVPLIC